MIPSIWQWRVKYNLPIDVAVVALPHSDGCDSTFSTQSVGHATSWPHWGGDGVMLGLHCKDKRHGIERLIISLRGNCCGRGVDRKKFSAIGTYPTSWNVDNGCTAIYSLVNISANAHHQQRRRRWARWRGQCKASWETDISRWRNIQSMCHFCSQNWI